MTYDELKTAQAAAFLLRQAHGRMPFIKLLKLLYLAERLSFQKHGFGLSGDVMVSMPHGPVLSRTYDHLKGARVCREGGWDTWIADEANYMVGLTEYGAAADDGELDDLSRSDKRVLTEVFDKFGAMGKWDLVNYTHTLPEWEDPKGGSVPISWRKLFKAIGFSDEQAEVLESDLRDQDALDEQFAH